MASMSDYLESGVINHIFRNDTFSKPSNISVALLSSLADDSDTGSTINEVASGLTRRPSPPRKEMKGPQNVDDIIKELEESDFEKDKKGKFSVNKKGKTSIQLDF